MFDRADVCLNEIPDLVKVTFVSSVGHEVERQYVMDSHLAGADVGERGAAVGAATVLVAAQRVADAGDGSAA